MHEERVTEELLCKLEHLKEYFRGMESVAVAFSSGVDSTFLLKVAHDVLGDRAVAITACASFFPTCETKEAEIFCMQEKIRQKCFRIMGEQIEGFCENPPERCYFCKKEIFQNILALAKEDNLCFVVEGSNVDDMADYRPGIRAIEEMGIKSPLRECGLTKKEIRILAKYLGLSVWDKPSYACLASRFVYGEMITEEKLTMVEQAEDFLRNLGFDGLRVRIHGKMARIEVLSKDIPSLLDEEKREKIVEKLHLLGFTYVTLDMQGYRTGSMNEII